MNETINPLVQIVYTIKAFNNTHIFYKLRRQSAGSKILYALIASCIACAVTFLAGGIKLSENRSLETLINDIPNFMYSEGNMLLDEKQELKVEQYYVLMDTSVMSWIDPEHRGSDVEGVDVSNQIDKLKNNSFNEAILVSRTNVLCIEEINNYPKYINLKWSDFFGILHINNLSKSQLEAGYKGVILKYSFILFLLAIPFRGMGLFFFALLWTILALIINAALKSEEKFTTLYWICFYIQSVIMIFMAIVKFLISINTFVMFCVLLICYIVVLCNVLKNGEPGTPIEFSSYSAIPNPVIEDDDFNRFMNDQDASAYDIDRQNPYGRTVQEDIYASHEQNYQYDRKEEQQFEETMYGQKNDEAQETSKTGLSLKIDD